MNYLSHVLRSNLQEWFSRLYKSPYDSFGERMEIFFGKLKSNNQLSSILDDLMLEYPYDVEQHKTIAMNLYKRADIELGSERERVALYYGFLTTFFDEIGQYGIHNYSNFSQDNYQQTKSYILERYISPIVNYLHDVLDESNSVTYLIEKYKMRTEWFTAKTLLEEYNKLSANYEQLFEDDLRLYLFDQGIDYPFSTPKSSSGRSDIIGQLDSKDPLIVEIKFLSIDKGYGKDRITHGYNQVLQYLNDYNKSFGYLVVFNTDQTNINIDVGAKKVFPVRISSGGKTVFIVIVQLNFSTTASKLKKSKEITISLEDFST